MIIVDWDLEAPGLENYFFPEQIEKVRAGDPAERRATGLQAEVSQLAPAPAATG